LSLVSNGRAEEGQRDEPHHREHTHGDEVGPIGLMVLGVARDAEHSVAWAGGEGAAGDEQASEDSVGALHTDLLTILDTARGVEA